MLVSDIMTRQVESVTPDTRLLDAIELMFENHYSGLPVVDKHNMVIGILTDYDLMVKGSSIHLPTFLKLFKEFSIYNKDKKLIKNDIQKIFRMKVKDAMNAEPLLLTLSATVDEVIKTYSEHHRVNPIPIVNSEKKLVGIISRFDAVKFFRSPSVHLSSAPSERELDENINKFLKDFESRFIAIGRFRTQYWLLINILFIFVGVILSIAFLVRITF